MAEVNGNTRVKLTNTTRNIIVLDDFKDVNGAPVVLGTEADRGIIGAPQPSVTVTLATARKMRENPALGAMLEDTIRVSTPFSF